jgi:hypothetical protein
MVAPMVGYGAVCVWYDSESCGQFYVGEVCRKAVQLPWRYFYVKFILKGNFIHFLLSMQFEKIMT